MDLGVEDREAQAVGGEGIQVAVRDAGDDAVAGQAGQVVGGLVDATKAELGFWRLPGAGAVNVGEVRICEE